MDYGKYGWWDSTCSFKINKFSSVNLAFNNVYLGPDEYILHTCSIPMQQVFELTDILV